MFIDLWEAVVNKYEITKFEETLIDDIQTCIMSYSRDIRQKLKERENAKIEKLWRWFDSVEEIHNYVNTKILNSK